MDFGSQFLAHRIWRKLLALKESEGTTELVMVPSVYYETISLGYSFVHHLVLSKNIGYPPKCPACKTRKMMINHENVGRVASGKCSHNVLTPTDIEIAQEFTIADCRSDRP